MVIRDGPRSGRIIRVKIDETLGTEVEPFHGKFYEAIAKSGLSVIAELKKASPSKGVLSKDFSYLSRAVAYEVAGADCVSCVTEPKWFLGEEEMITRVKKEIEVPITMVSNGPGRHEIIKRR